MEFFFVKKDILCVEGRVTSMHAFSESDFPLITETGQVYLTFSKAFLLEASNNKCYFLSNFLRIGCMH